MRNQRIVRVGWMVFFLSYCLWVYAETEPNNFLVNANPVSLNGSESGSLTTTLPVDVVDNYRFTTEVDGLLQVGVVPTADLQVSVRLLDANGIAVLGSNDGGSVGQTAGVIYNNLLAGTYYVVVAAIQGTGEYSIQVNFAPIEEIDLEPNDTPAQALPISANGEAEGHLGFHGNTFSDRFDFYSITTDADGILELTVFPDGNLNVGIGLWDTNRSKILADKNDKKVGESEKIVYENLAAGTYWVLLYQGAGYGSYTLSTLFTANPVPNDKEPNNRILEALDIPLSGDGVLNTGSVQGHLGYFGNLHKDVRDYYRITTPGYGTVSLGLKAEDAHNVSVGFSFYDESTRFLGQGNSFTLDGGVYYIQVGLAGRFGAYTLTATFESKEPPVPFSPTATDLSPNGSVENIVISADSPQVFYRITLPTDGALKFSTLFADSVAVFTNLYHENGLYIGRTDHWFTADQRDAVSPNLLAGNYYLEVVRRDGEGVGSLTTEFTPVPHIDSEPNDAWTDKALPISLSDTVVGHIGFTKNGWMDQTDSFILDIPDDGFLTMTSKTDDTFACFLNLSALKEDSSTVYLGRNDHWFTTDERSFTKPNLLAGKYLVTLDRRDGYGNYEFQFSFIPNRSGDPEPNDHIHEAVQVEINDGAIGHLGYDKVFRLDTVDWYRIELPAAGSLTLYTHTSDTMAIFANLYFADGAAYIGRNDHWFTREPRMATWNNLRAGVYYIQIARRDGYGTYELHTTFTKKQQSDMEQNDLVTLGQSLAMGTVAQGNLGYQDKDYQDREDFFILEVPTQGTYRFSYQQTDASMATYCYLLTSDMKTSLFRHDRWFTTGLSVKDLDLEAGVYYIQCLLRDGAGGYSVALTDGTTSTTGSLQGTVTSDTSFPLAQVDCAILDRKTQTDFLGGFTLDELPPGKYTVSFSSGAKYYPVNQQVVIQAGQTTQIDVTLFESNKTAPADTQWFRAFARDRYIHFAWLPSTSPDVADGGGYKLYINSNEPLDLGNVLLYRSDGFENGVEYTCRLTVYDKFGNESAGKTIVVTPSGEVLVPTPTPTLPEGVPTPTPTPTPTLTPTPAVVEPSPTPGELPPTPTPVEQPPVLEPQWVYEFDQATLADNGWAELPGGFGGATPGVVLPFYGFPDGQFVSSIDQRGAAVIVKPNEVAFLLTQQAINTKGLPALIRCSLKCTGSNATIAVGALKGAVFTGENLDGTIGYSLIMSAGNFMDKEGQITAVFRPDAGEIINPFIQIAGTEGNAVTAWIDRVDIFILEPGKAYSGELFGDLTP